MSLDFNELDDSFNTRVRDSFNTTTTNNNATLGVDVDNVGNEDNSVENSGNVDLDVEDSFHDGSHNADWDLEHVGNTGSYNETIEIVDESETDNSDHSVHDHSISAGNRSYDTGFRDLNLGGAGGAGGAGDTMIDNRATIVDQSVNSNILSGGGVGQWVDSEAVVASGDGAMAAGDDIEITQTLDSSTTITSGTGDVNVGNDVTITSVSDSYNTVDFTSSVTDNSVDVDIDDSFNDDSETYTADNSFNEEFTAVEQNEWDVDADVIWGEEDVIVVEDVSLEVED
ncbi:hypothetical protein [Microbacterium sp. Marseille-Q6965]|uniref:hypothetical protein n=1 Tax=Microbacterium sp. Marseille-Q6965 TaxID=2965072 RepID=UPI0021B72ADF|nr:hypothetical protein [Microbacterium sp. Marseille-Q6965]